MTNREEGVTKLTEALRKLELKQEKLENKQRSLSEKIAQTRSAIGGLTYILSEAHEQDQDQEEPREKEVIPGAGLYIGNRVRILNPSKGQENQGEVIGRTKNALIKIKTRTGNIIHRIPRNVKKL